jgi:multiple RNA-binding domain-containing protein 1
MSSSRVFVRGLPPAFTEDEFRRHFEIQPITDVKLMSQRRIGYIGYRTIEAAMKAIKHFNRSYIRMSRITVESARPVSAPYTVRR